MNWRFIPRRWFRFGLRTLLIVVFVAAAGFGWLASEIRQAKRQEAAAEALRVGGATVIFSHQTVTGYDRGILGVRPRIDDQERRGPSWLRDWLGVDLYSRVHSVTILRSEQDDRDHFSKQVSLLNDLLDLEELTLAKNVADSSTEMDLTGAEIGSLMRLPRLTRLKLK